MTDPQHVAGRLLALLLYGEHERFEPSASRATCARANLSGRPAIAGANGNLAEG